MDYCVASWDALEAAGSRPKGARVRVVEASDVCANAGQIQVRRVNHEGTMDRRTAGVDEATDSVN